MGYIVFMQWDVEYTDTFGLWWDELTEAEQEDIAVVVELLEIRGPQLPFPHSTGEEPWLKNSVISEKR